MRHGMLQSYAVVTAEDEKPCLGLQSLFCWVSIAKEDFAVALNSYFEISPPHFPKTALSSRQASKLQTLSSHNLFTSDLSAISIIFLSALSLLY